MDGGAGNEVVAGGGGAEVFVFEGHDLVRDLQNSDIIDLSGFEAVTDYEGLFMAAVTGGEDLIFDSRVDSLTLQDTALAELTAEQFAF